MPKPFMLGVEIEEIALGKVMRLLHKTPGVVKLHMEFNAAKPKGGKTGKQIILDLLAKGPMTAKDLAAKFREAGRSPVSVHSVLFALAKQKMIVHLADGQWKRK